MHCHHISEAFGQENVEKKLNMRRLSYRNLRNVGEPAEQLSNRSNLKSST